MHRKAKITSKRQIALPREVGRALGVQAGDKIVFEQKREEVRVRAVRKNSTFEKYRGIGNPGLPSGRNAVLKALREFRGQIEDE
jgi:AbrB family looped-hinge helix DNA binding protein